jgi:hypothetical protein
MRTDRQCPKPGEGPGLNFQRVPRRGEDHEFHLALGIVGQSDYQPTTGAFELDEVNVESNFHDEFPPVQRGQRLIESADSSKLKIGGSG